MRQGDNHEEPSWHLEPPRSPVDAASLSLSLPLLLRSGRECRGSTSECQVLVLEHLSGFAGWIPSLLPLFSPKR